MCLERNLVKIRKKKRGGVWTSTYEHRFHALEPTSVNLPFVQWCNLPSARARWASSGQSIILLPMKNMAFRHISSDKLTKFGRLTGFLVFACKKIVKGVMRTVRSVIKSVPQSVRLIWRGKSITCSWGFIKTSTSGTSAISGGSPGSFGVRQLVEVHQQSGSLELYLNEELEPGTG
jgi:hypothetical protein